MLDLDRYSGCIISTDMTRESLLEKLEILENKIFDLLELVNTLKKKNEELAMKLIEKEDEANRLMQEMENLLGEKEQVKQKVAHLIKCVETF
jgi:chromosome segregation ATPase